jgi:hypothetical protein
MTFIRGGAFRTIPHDRSADRGRHRAAASAPPRAGQADSRGTERQIRRALVTRELTDPTPMQVEGLHALLEANPGSIPAGVP